MGSQRRIRRDSSYARHDRRARGRGAATEATLYILGGRPAWSDHTIAQVAPYGGASGARERPHAPSGGQIEDALDYDRDQSSGPGTRIQFMVRSNPMCCASARRVMCAWPGLFQTLEQICALQCAPNARDGRVTARTLGPSGTLGHLDGLGPLLASAPRACAPQRASFICLVVTRHARAAVVGPGHAPHLSQPPSPAPLNLRRANRVKRVFFEPGTLCAG